MKGRLPGGWPLLPVIAFVALFSVLPAAVLFAGAVAGAGGLGGWAAIVGGALERRAIENSLLQGSISAALAVAVGYPTGVFLGRYAWPGQRTVGAFLLVPFLLPTLVVVLGLLDVFGPQGLLSAPFPALGWFGRGTPGIVAANLIFNVPVVVLFTATGCEARSAELEETVVTLGAGPARAYRDAWAGPTWVGAVAGGLLTFLFSALGFAAPLLLCRGPSCYTVEAVVWFLDQQLLEPTAAGALALTLVLLFLLPTVAYLLLLGRLRGRGSGRPAPRRPVPWRSPVGVGLALVTGAVLSAEFGLLAVVLARSVVPASGGAPGAEWARLLGVGRSEGLGLPIGAALGNTLLFASLASGVVLVLAVLAGSAIARRPDRAAPLGLLLFVPVLLSPVVLALALATFWRPLLGGESMVWLLVVLSQATIALPFAVQSVALPLARLGPAAGEAARTLGASPWGAYLDAELPRARDGLRTAALFAWALGLGEFTATYFLVTPRFTTLPVAVYELESTRAFAVGGAAAGLLLLLSLAVFALLTLGSRRVEF